MEEAAAGVRQGWCRSAGHTAAGPGRRGTPGRSGTRTLPAGGRLILLLLMMMPLMIPGAMAVPMDMCGGSSGDSGGDGSSQPSTHGVVASQDYPEHTTALQAPDQCSCNFSSPQQTALLSLRLFLESDFSDMCDPVLLMMPYQICPALRANRSLNVLLPANEQILLTLNNPNHIRHRFYITYSAERPLHVECGPTWFVDLPPIVPAAGYDVTPTLPPGAIARDARAHLPAIIASIIIAVIVVALIIAAIIRWRCVVSNQKKKGLGQHINDNQGDNPAFQHTPKSSIFDVRAPSISSLIGIGQDLQPRQAPITGVGLLAAHSEPRLPPRPKVSNGGPYFGNGVPSRGDDPKSRAPTLDHPEGPNHVGNGGQPGYGHPGDNMGYTPNGGYSDDMGGYPTPSGHPGQNNNGYPPKGGHPGQGDEPKQRVPPRNRGQPGQKSHPKPRGHPPLQEGYPNYAYDPKIDPQQRQPQYSQPLGARPGAPSSTVSSGLPPSRNGPHGPSFNTDGPSQYAATPPRTPPRGVSKHPRGAGKPGRPFEEVGKAKDGGQTEMYACAYCDQTEARYGRIICHLVKEHPDSELSFSRLKPLSGGWQGGESPLSTVERPGTDSHSKDPDSNSTPILNPIHDKQPSQASYLTPRSTQNPSTARQIATAQDFIERPIPDVILDQLRDLNLTPTMNADVQLSSPSPTPSLASTNLPSSLSPPPSLCSTQPMTPNSLLTPSPSPNHVPARGILSLISFFESGPKTAATDKEKEDPNKDQQNPIHPKGSGEQVPLSQMNGHKEPQDGDHYDPACQVNRAEAVPDSLLNGECEIPNRSSDTHLENQPPRRNKKYYEPPSAGGKVQGSPKKSPARRRNNFKEFVNGEQEHPHEGLVNGDQDIPMRSVNGHQDIPRRPMNGHQDIPMRPMNGEQHIPKRPMMNGDQDIPMRPVNGEQHIPKRPMNGDQDIPMRPVNGEQHIPKRPMNGDQDIPMRPVNGDQDIPVRPVMNGEQHIPMRPENGHQDIPMRPVNGDQDIPMWPVNGEMLHSRRKYKENGFMPSVSEDPPISNHYSRVNKTPKLARNKHKRNNSRDYAVEESQPTNHQNSKIKPPLPSPRATPRLSMSLGQGGDLNSGQGRSQHQDPAEGHGEENSDSEPSPAVCGRWMGRSMSYTSDIPLNVY